MLQINVTWDEFTRLGRATGPCDRGGPRQRLCEVPGLLESLLTPKDVARVKALAYEPMLAPSKLLPAKRVVDVPMRDERNRRPWKS